MPTLEINTLVNATNADIANTIRDHASNEYRERVPEATQSNLQLTLDRLTDYRPAWNEFQAALINRIGMVIGRSLVWSNPLAPFKRGLMNNGDTIEEINVGLIKAKTYRKDRESLEKDVFGRYPADVQTSYHTINREEYYAVTINEALLKRAFVENGQLSKFVTDLMAAPTNSDQYDEFLITTALFKEYYDNGGFFKIQVPDLIDDDSTAADAKVFLRRSRSIAGKLEFPVTYYNASRMPVATDPEDLLLFIDPDALAATDVEALAGAFNLDKSTMTGRIINMPKEFVNIPGYQAILTTKDFFVIADTVLETASIFNPANLSTNHFFHHHEIVSASRFVNAILFTTEEGTDLSSLMTPVSGVNAVIVANDAGTTVTSVERGKNYQIATTAVTTPANGDNDAVRLSVTGSTDTHTFVTQAGVLYVGPGEDATTLTVKAIATDNNTFSASTTVNVVGESVKLWPNAEVKPDTDKDGLFEATPKVLTMNSTTKIVKIPTVTGVQYKKAGVDVADGSSHTITGTVAFTAVAKTGFELAAGAVTSWSFTA